MKKESMDILAIVGSPRLEGNTNYLVDKALAEAARMGAGTEKLVLSEYDVKPCLGHENCSTFATCLQEDDTAWILDRFCQVDGVILATPVYYYNVSAQMKAFIDRNYFLYKHGRKSRARAVGIIVVAGGNGIEDTLHTLRQFIALSFHVDEGRILIATGCANRPGQVNNDLPFVEQACNLGRRMMKILKQGS
ncbi:flavodoxin family protein [Chloroflexota bacterium]